MGPPAPLLAPLAPLALSLLAPLLAPLALALSLLALSLALSLALILVPTIALIGTRVLFDPVRQDVEPVRFYPSAMLQLLPFDVFLRPGTFEQENRRRDARHAGFFRGALCERLLDALDDAHVRRVFLLGKSVTVLFFELISPVCAAANESACS